MGPAGPAGGSGVLKGTGRERGEWFELLDEWGAAGRPYREIADWLMTGQGLSAWWAQKLVVEYEQARGLRSPGVRPDGTFTVTASKTVAAPVERLEQAFSDADLRGQWLPDVQLRERSSRAGRSARFDCHDSTRLAVTFSDQGRGRTQVAVEHEQLPDPRSAEVTKAYWRERLSALKALLES